MPENKTKPTEISAASFLEVVEPDSRRAEGRALDALFRRVTGWEPRMWGSSIVGYGRYRYTYESGRTGEACATGFSPRKAEIVVYVMTGHAALEAQLARLGKHKLGKSCIYIKRLIDVDAAVLGEIIQAGIADPGARWPVDAG